MHIGGTQTCLSASFSSFISFSLALTAARAFLSSARFSNVVRPALGRKAVFGMCHCLPVERSKASVQLSFAHQWRQAHHSCAFPVQRALLRWSRESCLRLRPPCVVEWNAGSGAEDQSQQRRVVLTSFLVLGHFWGGLRRKGLAKKKFRDDIDAPVARATLLPRPANDKTPAEGRTQPHTGAKMQTLEDQILIR